MVQLTCVETAVYRISQLYGPLVSYFKSEDESQTRFYRLQVVFEDPMTEM